jgi:hypothetical protein
MNNENEVLRQYSEEEEKTAKTYSMEALIFVSALTRCAIADMTHTKLSSFLRRLGLRAIAGAWQYSSGLRPGGFNFSRSLVLFVCKFDRNVF